MDKRTSKQIDLFFEERRRVASRREAALNLKEKELAEREEELTAFYESITEKLEALINETEKSKKPDSSIPADHVESTWLKQSRLREDEYLARIQELKHTIRSLKDENEKLVNRNEELKKEKTYLMKRLAAT